MNSHHHSMTKISIGITVGIILGLSLPTWAQQNSSQNRKQGEASTSREQGRESPKVIGDFVRLDFRVPQAKSEEERLAFAIAKPALDVAERLGEKARVLSAIGNIKNHDGRENFSPDQCGMSKNIIGSKCIIAVKVEAPSNGGSSGYGIEIREGNGTGGWIALYEISGNEIYIRKSGGSGYHDILVDPKTDASVHRYVGGQYKKIGIE